MFMGLVEEGGSEMDEGGLEAKKEWQGVGRPQG